MEFLKKNKEVASDKMDELSELARQQRVYEDNIDEAYVKKIIDRPELLGVSIKTLEEIAKKQKERLNKIKQDKIPAIMNELSFSELKLKTGHKLIVKDQVKPSLAKERMLDVISLMIQAEIDEGSDPELARIIVYSLFKNNLVTPYDKKAVNNLLKAGIPFEQDLSIHHKTLEKYCKDRIEAGKDIPEGILVFKFQETKLT